MSELRIKRRVAKMISARLEDLELGQLEDPRKRRGRRWSLQALLRAVVVGMMAGSKSMAQLESLTAEMSPAMRRVLGIRRRVPDTTVRDLLCRLDPLRLRAALHRLVRAAHRRKALEPERLPFGVAAMDGKGTAIDAIDNHYAQRHAEDEHRGMVRTITASLASARGRPCIDAFPVHASTNETGQFETALGALMDAYQGLGLFRVVSYDAGACSLYNADCVRKHGLEYLFGLKNSQPTLRLEAERLLGCATDAAAKSEDVVGPNTVVRRVYVSDEIAGFLEWAHLKTVVRIEAEMLARDGTRLTHENRYYISSLPMAELTAAQWLLLVRVHWGVENNCHHTLDAVLREDEHPWIETCPRATVAVIVLRRIACTVLTLFRSVTQRSQERRSMPWRDLVRAIYNAMISVTEPMLARRLPASFVTP